MGLVSLIYDSSSVTPFSEAELLRLLIGSRAKNTKLSVTGLLLYKQGEFMQVLEGEKQIVEKLFSLIEADPRHRGCTELRWEFIKQRSFPDWSMGFRNLDHHAALHQMAGYSEFMNVPLTSTTFAENPSRAHKLLTMFKGDS